MKAISVLLMGPALLTIALMSDSLPKNPEAPAISTELQIEFLKAYGDQATAALAAERAGRAFEAVRNKLIARCGEKADLTVNEKGVAGCAAKAEPPKPEAEKPAPKPER